MTDRHWDIQQQNEDERLQYVDIRYAKIHTNPKIFSEKSIFHPKNLEQTVSGVFSGKHFISQFIFPIVYESEET